MCWLAGSSLTSSLVWECIFGQFGNEALPKLLALRRPNSLRP
jgi:hypothetical protein